jgi:hypothetical protein
MLQTSNPERAKQLLQWAQKEVHTRYALYEQLAKLSAWSNGGGSAAQG